MSPSVFQQLMLIIANNFKIFKAVTLQQEK